VDRASSRIHIHRHRLQQHLLRQHRRWMGLLRSRLDVRYGFVESGESYAIG
jgi:hypothetical protein